jgi:hypothetical protein
MLDAGCAVCGEAKHPQAYACTRYEASVVVTCALVNRMKTDLTDAQFKAMVCELARVFAGGTFSQRAFPEGVSP